MFPFSDIYNQCLLTVRGASRKTKRFSSSIFHIFVFVSINSSLKLTEEWLLYTNPSLCIWLGTMLSKQYLFIRPLMLQRRGEGRKVLNTQVQKKHSLFVPQAQLQTWSTSNHNASDLALGSAVRQTGLRASYIDPFDLIIMWQEGPAAGEKQIMAAKVNVKEEIWLKYKIITKENNIGLHRMPT